MGTTIVTADHVVCSTLEDQSYRGYILPEYIRQRNDAWKDLIAFESAETGVKYTHSQILENSRAFAASLINHGFQKGEIIAVVLPNIPEYSSIVFGIWEAGLVASLMNPLYTAEEITCQLELCGIKSIVTNADTLKTVRSIDGARKIIMVGDAEEGCVATFHEMIQTRTEGINFTTGSSIDTDDETALVLFSSGTTGVPKAVMLTHKNVTANALQFTLAIQAVNKACQESDQERVIAVIPFFHSYGFQSVLCQSLLKGAYVLTMRKFQPSLFKDALRQHRPTFLVVVPTVVSFLSSDLVTKEDTETIHTVLCGGGSTLTSISEQFKKKNSALLLLGYGLTELSPLSHVGLKEKFGTIGPPIPMTSAKVVDTTTGESLGRNSLGEICVKGPQVMKGYFNNEAATNAMIDKEGWLHTGDLGYYDEENYFVVVDRLKDIIKVKGFQVSPTELENLLNTHENVADVAVIGVPDPTAGELPRAYVVPKKGETISEQELHHYILGRVAPFKQLKGGIEFLQEIPRNPSGKILRKELLQRYKSSHL